MKTKQRKLKYYVPVEVKFTATQMKAIVAENMENWGITEEQALQCNDQDVFAAASRLGFIDIPIDAKFDEDLS